MKRLAVVACGCLAGFLLGPISLLMNDVSDRLIRGWDWRNFDEVYFMWLALTSIPAAVNGALGAALVAVSNDPRRLGITLLPASLHILASIALLVDLDTFLLAQMVALMFSVVIWSAGRLGQSIGSLFRLHDPSLRSCEAPQLNTDLVQQPIR